MGGLLAALGIGGGTAAGATAAGAAGAGMGLSSLPAAMVGSAGTGALTGAATSMMPSVLAGSTAGSLAGGNMIANALKGINSFEQQPAVQLAQKLRPLFNTPPAPPLSQGGGGSQVIQRKRTRMFE